MLRNQFWAAIAVAMLAILSLLSPAQAVLDPPATDGPADRRQADQSPRLIIELESPPLAVAYRDQVGAARANGALDVNSPFAAAYVAQLEAEQAAFVAAMQEALPNAAVSTFVNESGYNEAATYQITFNGVSVDVSATGKTREAARALLERMPDVKAVYYDRPYFTQLYTSTSLINAPVLWHLGGGRENAGAGVKVASMDGGIHKDAPMFSGAGYSYPPGYGPNGLGLTANNNGKIIVSRAYFRPWDPPLPESAVPWPGAYDDSHGVHTASTAAGNVVTATVGGFSVGQISGVAPRAYVMSYKVFYTSVSFNSSFYTTEGLAALEDIVRDGADVVNNSWGSGPVSEGGPFDPIDAALINAHNAGVFVSMSAGNSGPGYGTTDHPSPEYMTVAATTTGGTLAAGRVYVPAIPALGNLPFGVARFGAPLPETAVITYTVLPASAVDASNIEGCAAWPANTFTGKAALIKRGSCEFGLKVLNAERGGAAFVVIYNHEAGGDAIQDMGPGSVGLEVAISSIFIGNTAGNAIVDAHGSNPGIELVVDTVPYQAGNTPDIVADFSNRGPGVGNVLKPDIAAPGVNILAQGYDGYHLLSEAVHLGYGEVSGTSMAAPHIAGSAALLRQLHPGWPNSWIKSALMSTAKYTDVYNWDGTPAQPLDMGAGRVDLSHAADPGVILDPPSLSFGTVPTGTTKIISVTVTSVAGGSETYNLSTLFTGDGFTQTTALPGFVVSPDQLTLNPGETKVVTVTFDPATSRGYGDNQGYIVMDGTQYDAHLPAWARASYGTQLADVLIIDNDFSDGIDLPDYSWYYTDTLTQLGLTYDLWNVDDFIGSDRTIPDATTLAGYGAVLHYTGDNYFPDGAFAASTGLTPLDLNTLTEYLSGGGRLIAMGQDYSSAIGDDVSSRFYFGFNLGAKSIQDSVVNDATPNQLLVPAPGVSQPFASAYVDLTKPRQYDDESLLTGAAEAPPVNTETTGKAILSYDVTRKQLQSTVTVEASPSTPITVTAAHIHVGAPGVNGPPVFTLFSGSQVVTETMTIEGEITLDSAQEADLLAGNYYINVHTTANPNGEIRGQIQLVDRDNQLYMDELEHIEGDSVPVLRYGGPYNLLDGTVALARRAQPSLENPGITYRGRSFYTAFGLEGMSEEDNADYQITPLSRAEFMARILKWLESEAGTVVVTPTLVTTSTLYSFTVTYEPSETAPTAVAAGYRWDFGDGSPYIAVPALPYASHTYTCSGDNRHTVRVEVTDSYGNVAIGSTEVDATGNCVTQDGFNQMYLPIISKQ